METLQKARRYARRWFDQNEDGNHPSFVAERALLAANARYKLGCDSVEGTCDEVGKNGYHYLNTGETYTPTLIAETTPNSVRFLAMSLGDYTEMRERRAEAD